MQSSEVMLPGWAVVEGMAAQNVIFNLKFSVPKTFGIPGAIIVHNSHPNEFLLLSFELELPDKSTHQYYTNSWIYNTDREDHGRIFFHNKVGQTCASKFGFCKFNGNPRSYSRFHLLSRLG